MITQHGMQSSYTITARSPYALTQHIALFLTSIADPESISTTSANSPNRHLSLYPTRLDYMDVIEAHICVPRSHYYTDTRQSLDIEGSQCCSDQMSTHLQATYGMWSSLLVWSLQLCLRSTTYIVCR
jgi:hypothetical protein